MNSAIGEMRGKVFYFLGQSENATGFGGRGRSLRWMEPFGRFFSDENDLPVLPECLSDCNLSFFRKRKKPMLNERTTSHFIFSRNKSKMALVPPSSTALAIGSVEQAQGYSDK
jgi:hypothetical protein